MISLKYELTTYKDFLENLADFVGVKVVDNTVRFPEHFGEGFMHRVELGDGAEGLITYLKLKHDLVLERQQTEREYYTFCFEELKDINEFSMRIGPESFKAPDKSLSAMYMTSFLHDVGYFFKHDGLGMSIRVLVSPEWLQKFLEIDKTKEVLQQYLELKTAGVLYKKLTPEARELMHELLKYRGGGGPALLFYQTRLLRLVEIFSNWLSDAMKRPHAALNISKEDIESMRRVEAMLSATITTPPTIPELAREAAMSESKLKKLFKTIYGQPPYEYFQKNRMKRAKLMLLSGNYSIKDVGYALGYTNLSNFTLAFKKEFAQLPSEVLK